MLQVERTKDDDFFNKKMSLVRIIFNNFLNSDSNLAVKECNAISSNLPKTHTFPTLLIFH